MIQNNRITYGAVDSPLLYWEFENTALNTIAIAAVTTVLSYQIAAIFYDALLGLKGKGFTCISDMHILLLTRQSSPVAILNAVLRKDWLTRRHFRGNLSGARAIARSTKQVRVRVHVKLFILLAIAPIANITSIALTLETEKMLSFEEAEFGGLAVGVSSDLSFISLNPFHPGCAEGRLQTVTGEQSIAFFSLCSTPNRLVNESLVGKAAAEVLLISKRSVVVGISVDSHVWYTIIQGTLFTNNTLYYIRHNLTFEIIGRLVNVGVNLLFEECGTKDETIHTDFNPSFENGAIYQRKVLNCRHSGDPTKIASIVLSKLQKYVTFVDTEKLEVLSLWDLDDDTSGHTGQPAYHSADKLPLLIRVRRNVSLSFICIATVTALAVRVAVKLTCKNDVSEGLEHIVTEQAALESYSSLLKCDQTKISYNNKHQLGNLGQYGLAQSDMPEVEQFEDAIVGIAPVVHAEEADYL